MFILFRYDPESSRSAEHRAANRAIITELGRIGAFFSRASAHKSTRAAAAVLGAVTFGVLEDATHEVVINMQLHPALKAMADGFIVATCGGAVVWLLLTALSHRHDHAHSQQRAFTQLDAEVQAALNSIVLANASATPRDRETVIRGVERIEAAMHRAKLAIPTDTADADKTATAPAALATSAH
jgi:hypothetical protein